MKDKIIALAIVAMATIGAIELARAGLVGLMGACK